MDAETLEDLARKLTQEFHRLNRERFDGIIEDYGLRFSRRAVRTHGSVNYGKKEIMLSLPLYEQYGWNTVVNTLLHEMTHALIHQQGGQNRHTKRFWREFEKHGGVRDNIDVMPEKTHVYACTTCGREFSRMRKIRKLWKYSCIKCDRKYNPKHRLYLRGED